MNIALENTGLDNHELQTIQNLLDSQNPDIKDDLNQIWYLMDKVWYEYGCDNKALDWSKIGEYYNHPVWVLNGLFIENDEISMQIRQNIASHIAQSDFQTILDYGGGFGSLAKVIADKCPQKQIFIYEPFPSKYGKKCIEGYKNISFISQLEGTFDCLISTDVLEHVDDPLETFAQMIAVLKIGGEAIIANCFYPCIQCHLPKNFHYRYSFNFFATKMGMKNQGMLKNTHATLFSKIKDQKLGPKLKSIGGGGK
ncbi:class I SAM-dependent methyltransferase [Helicobacter sp. 13S00477-4]|uniref:class I SAM-dependent methyltransferase n=1 Tax=Helicobacter sp. 13S00477-4 TaxID=1905759 RepID=UPI002151CF4C|nr:class I SAM-dependent methyltransferase [Helicobacter sp. 13S00477-4]